MNLYDDLGDGVNGVDDIAMRTFTILNIITAFAFWRLDSKVSHCNLVSIFVTLLCLLWSLHTNLAASR